MSVPKEYLNRSFETQSDRQANARMSSDVRNREGRQRSYSIERHYKSGEVDRVHVHNNLHNGNPQFEHVIGGWDKNGNYSGRPL